MSESWGLCSCLVSSVGISHVTPLFCIVRLMRVNKDNLLFAHLSWIDIGLGSWRYTGRGTSRKLATRKRR